MIEKILENDAQQLLSLQKVSYLEREVWNTFHNQNKLIGIIGMRGVGKSTYLLHQRKKTDKSIYISCDLYFLSEYPLYEIISDLYKSHGITTFFLDEVHEIKDWDTHLKNIYDTFPVYIVFSGSNMINITHGGRDLSRRAILYTMPFFSFGEWMSIIKGIPIPNYALQELLENHVEISRQQYYRFHKSFFAQYLHHGQFGYTFSEHEDEYQLRLGNAIKKSLYQDIPQFENITTSNLRKIEDILIILAKSGSSENSINSIAKKISLSPNITTEYLTILESLGLIYAVSFDGNLSDSIRKAKKYCISATNISYLFSNDIGSIRESFFLGACKKDKSIQISYQSLYDYALQIGDKKILVEVGGQNKKNDHVQYIIKDDITIGDQRNIPLRLFGLL